MFYSTEDSSSIGAVLAMLESEAAKMGPKKSNIVHLWRDWTDLLGPTAIGQPDRALGLLALEYVTPGGVAAAITEAVADAATTIRVPSAFATALLDDWREPPDDPDREHITDPEQLAYEVELDACLTGWGKRA